jgi:hypothetical protein
VLAAQCSILLIPDVSSLLLICLLQEMGDERDDFEEAGWDNYFFTFTSFMLISPFDLTGPQPKKSTNQQIIQELAQPVGGIKLW